MAPRQPLTVTLEAQQWDAVMRVMAKSPIPYEIVAPLIQAIQQQCMAASAQVPEPAASGARPNSAALTEDARE